MYNVVLMLEMKILLVLWEKRLAISHVIYPLGHMTSSQMDENMQMFHKQVKGFVKNHTHMSHPYYPEE